MQNRVAGGREGAGVSFKKTFRMCGGRVGI